jgi:hypothetical protein
VDDERIVCWPPLRCEQSSHRFAIEGVHAEPIYRLCREGDEPSAPQPIGGARDPIGLRPLRIDLNDFRHHQNVILRWRYAARFTP